MLVAAAEGARRLLADELGADFLAAVPHGRAPTRPSGRSGDVAVLASASAARALAATGARLPVVAIGPQTAAAARAAGLEVVAEAETHDADGLVAAVEAVAAGG